MKTSLALSTGLLFLLSCVSAQPEQPGKIELRMKPGESANYALHAETTTNYVSHGARGPVRRTISFKSDMKVLLRCVSAPADGVLNVEITYPEFSMETAMLEGGSIAKVVSDRIGARSYVDGKLEDSLTWEELEKRGRPNLAKLFSLTIGFTLDKTGRVVATKAPADLTASFPGVDIKQFFQSQVIFPGVPIVPGAEWSQTTEREVSRAVGPLRRQVITDEILYKYLRNELAEGRQCARIRTEVTTRPKEKVPDLEKFEQTTKGWSLVALDNGQLVRSELNLSQEIKGTFDGIETDLKTTGVVKTSLVQTPAADAASGEEKPRPRPGTE